MDRVISQKYFGFPSEAKATFKKSKTFSSFLNLTPMCSDFTASLPTKAPQGRIHLRFYLAFYTYIFNSRKLSNKFLDENFTVVSEKELPVHFSHKDFSLASRGKDCKQKR